MATADPAVEALIAALRALSVAQQRQFALRWNELQQAAPAACAPVTAPSTLTAMLERVEAELMRATLGRRAAPLSSPSPLHALPSRSLQLYVVHAAWARAVELAARSPKPGDMITVPAVVAPAGTAAAASLRDLAVASGLAVPSRVILVPAAALGYRRRAAGGVMSALDNNGILACAVLGSWLAATVCGRDSQHWAAKAAFRLQALLEACPVVAAAVTLSAALVQVHKATAAAPDLRTEEGVGAASSLSAGGDGGAVASAHGSAMADVPTPASPIRRQPRSPTLAQARRARSLSPTGGGPHHSPPPTRGGGSTMTAHRCASHTLAATTAASPLVVVITDCQVLSSHSQEVLASLLHGISSDEAPRTAAMHGGFVPLFATCSTSMPATESTSYAPLVRIGCLTDEEMAGYAHAAASAAAPLASASSYKHALILEAAWWCGGLPELLDIALQVLSSWARSDSGSADSDARGARLGTSITSVTTPQWQSLHLLLAQTLHEAQRRGILTSIDDDGLAGLFAAAVRVPDVPWASQRSTSSISTASPLPVGGLPLLLAALPRAVQPLRIDAERNMRVQLAAPQLAQASTAMQLSAVSTLMHRLHAHATSAARAAETAVPLAACLGAANPINRTLSAARTAATPRCWDITVLPKPLEPAALQAWIASTRVMALEDPAGTAVAFLNGSPPWGARNIGEVDGFIVLDTAVVLLCDDAWPSFSRGPSGIWGAAPVASLTEYARALTSSGEAVTSIRVVDDEVGCAGGPTDEPASVLLGSLVMGLRRRSAALGCLGGVYPQRVPHGSASAPAGDGMPECGESRALSAYGGGTSDSGSAGSVWSGFLMSGRFRDWS